MLAYILSVQFCAARLNATCGALQTTTYVDRFENDVLVSLDDMTVQTRGLLCDPCAANSGPQPRPGFPECRATIQFCLNEWDNINSEGSILFTKTANKEETKYVSPY